MFAPRFSPNKRMQRPPSASTPAATGTATEQHWINISQRPAKRYFWLVAVVLAVLLIGAAAVAHRALLCQLQAYAILLLSFVSFALYVNYTSVCRECTVDTLRSPYCIECRRESRGAMVVGRQVADISSNYERFYMSMMRMHLAAFVWLAG